MSRLEVSICQDALIKFSPALPSVKTAWYSRIQSALRLLETKALNDPQVLDIAYRKMSLPILLGELSKTEANLLAIGRKNSWLINASTATAYYFTGTRLPLGLNEKTMDFKAWRKLRDFALRYATPGSTVRVFALHSQSGPQCSVSEFQKEDTAPW